MLLAQVEQFVYNAPDPWWTVGTGLGAAVLAGIFATIGWYVVHRTSNARELTKWRRDTLTKATATFFQDARTFETMVIDVIHPVDPKIDYEFELYKQYEKLESLIFTMQITEAKKTAGQASKIKQFYSDQMDILGELVDLTNPSERKEKLDKFHDEFVRDRPDAEVLRGLLKEDLKNNL